MITGAQAGIPAIGKWIVSNVCPGPLFDLTSQKLSGLSGPNALISGRSFSPPVTAEQLNKYTFNIMPNRDIVAMLDDPADQIQRLVCRSDLQASFGCHLAERSLCEIMYTCGSKNRPYLCECYTRYDYPKPEGDEELFDSICQKEP